jgi:menaquinone-9 beta-reductase
MNQPFDALVIGGGPGGATAGLLLAKAGWSVCLLEQKQFPRGKVCGEYVSATTLPLLEHLAIADLFLEKAGPPIRRVGLFAGETIAVAPLPNSCQVWGRALGREHLDTLLLHQAQAAGVEVRQPYRAVSLTRDGCVYFCMAQSPPDGRHFWIRSRIVIAAHGSWDRGPLPTQHHDRRVSASNLIGFKAHFTGSSLPPDLMPLLTFPGGYGGMVESDSGRLSLSCCVRRDVLSAIRRKWDGKAGEAVFEYILDSCRGAQQVLRSARREGDWFAAGPIRPGTRFARQRPGLFLVGNAAGEAHPVVAEGISMAMQSAWLLAKHLIDWRREGGNWNALRRVGEQYAGAWQRSFAPRLYVSRLLAQWAMRPAAVLTALPLVRHAPEVLYWCALLSGKATRVL